MQGSLLPRAIRLGILPESCLAAENVANWKGPNAVNRLSKQGVQLFLDSGKCQENESGGLNARLLHNSIDVLFFWSPTVIRDPLPIKVNYKLPRDFTQGLRTLNFTFSIICQINPTEDLPKALEGFLAS